MHGFIPLLPLLAAPAGLQAPPPLPDQSIRARITELLADRKARVGAADWEAVLAESRDLQARVEALLQTERNPAARDLLQLARLQVWQDGHVAPPPQVCLEVLRNVAPDSAAWVDQPRLLRTATGSTEAVGRQYLDALATRHASPDLQRMALVELHSLARRQGQPEQAREALARLVARFPDARETAAARTLEARYAKADQGLPAPAFALPAIPAGAAPVRLSDFKGRFVLLDFWATWCAPCRGEIPNLRRVHDQFKGRPFEILSISCDKQPSVVETFLAQGTEAMPWRHAFLEGGIGGEVGRSYGLKGVPRLLLIGPDGRVLASDGQLRGEQLARTLGRLLPPPTPAPKG